MDMGSASPRWWAAQQFNQREKEPVDIVYGIVTTGDVWRFLSLKGTDVNIDRETYLSRSDRTTVRVLWRITE
jgi:hypothetical protein